MSKPFSLRFTEFYFRQIRCYSVDFGFRRCCEDGRWYLKSNEKAICEIRGSAVYFHPETSLKDAQLAKSSNQLPQVLLPIDLANEANPRILAV